jgi:muramoyltetrapeptide carboxypeptidase
MTSNNSLHIGVFSPSSYVEKQDIEDAKTVLESQGHRVFIHPQTYERHNQSAGTHAQKIEALHSLYTNDEIDLIWAAGGGNRSLHILDDLDFDLIRANPKPMIGFSDVTALLNGISVKTGAPNIHGPVFKHVSKHQEGLKALSENFVLPLHGAHTLNHGHAEGMFFGGNLSLFQYLPQTLGKDFTKGSILFLEDCHEELSRIDRMMLHLRRLGVFEHAAGLMFGSFTALQDSATPFGFTLQEIIAEHTDGLDIPIVMNLPFGHGEQNHPLPIGIRGVFDPSLDTLFVKNNSYNTKP